MWGWGPHQSLAELFYVSRGLSVGKDLWERALSPTLTSDMALYPDFRAGRLGGGRLPLF